MDCRKSLSRTGSWDQKVRWTRFILALRSLKECDFDLITDSIKHVLHCKANRSIVIYSDMMKMFEDIDLLNKEGFASSFTMPMIGSKTVWWVASDNIVSMLGWKIKRIMIKDQDLLRKIKS